MNDDEPKTPAAKHVWELAKKAQRRGNTALGLALAMASGALDAFEEVKTENHPIWSMIRERG